MAPRTLLCFVLPKAFGRFLAGFLECCTELRARESFVEICCEIVWLLTPHGEDDTLLLLS